MFNEKSSRNKSLLSAFRLSGQRVLGDMPAADIFKIFNNDESATFEAIENLGYSFLYIDPQKAKAFGNHWSSIYMYDRKALQTRLNDKKDLLDIYDWPKDANTFTEYVYAVLAPAKTPLYDFIADLHGDNSNPWRNNNGHNKFMPDDILRHHQLSMITKHIFESGASRPNINNIRVEEYTGIVPLMFDDNVETLEQ